MLCWPSFFGVLKKKRLVDGMTVPQLRRGVWRKKRRQRIQMESARFPRCAGAASGFRGIQLFFVDGICLRSCSNVFQSCCCSRSQLLLRLWASGTQPFVPVWNHSPGSPGACSSNVSWGPDNLFRLLYCCKGGLTSSSIIVSTLSTYLGQFWLMGWGL